LFFTLNKLYNSIFIIIEVKYELILDKTLEILENYNYNMLFN